MKILSYLNICILEHICLVSAQILEKNYINGTLLTCTITGFPHLW